MGEVTETKETKDDEPAAKKQKVETETKSVKKKMTFVSMAETMKVDWSSELYSRRVKRMDPSFFLLQILFQFQSETGFKPRPGNKQEDIKKLKQLRNVTLEKMKVPASKVDDAMLEVLFGELSPVCAIVGEFLPRRSSKPSATKMPPITIISSIIQLSPAVWWKLSATKAIIRKRNLKSIKTKFNFPCKSERNWCFV